MRRANWRTYALPEPPTEEELAERERQLTEVPPWSAAELDPEIAAAAARFDAMPPL